MADSPSLGSLIDEPESVAFAGRTVIVGEIRLRDIGGIERALTRLVGDPMDLLPGAGDDPAAPAYFRSLRRAKVRADALPIRWGTPLAAALLATLPGQAAYLAVVLARTEPAIAGDPIECLSLAVAATADDWAALDRVAWALSVSDLIARKVQGAGDPGDDDGDGDDPAPVQWGVWVASLAKHFHLAPAAILDLTLSQFRNLASEGKGEAAGQAFAGAAHLAKLRAGRKHWFHPSEWDAERDAPAVSFDPDAETPPTPPPSEDA